MSNDIRVVTTRHQTANRSWCVSLHGTEVTPNVQLDVSAFTAATHYPNGYLLSGIVLGEITATGLYGPYDDTLETGQEVAAGILWDDERIPDLSALTKDKAGTILIHGFVKTARLPIANAATGGGFIDAGALVDLKHIIAV
jgi:Bacteriophage lambda head decoration protein D